MHGNQQFGEASGQGGNKNKTCCGGRAAFRGPQLIKQHRGEKLALWPVFVTANIYFHWYLKLHFEIVMLLIVSVLILSLIIV